jgi:hypothetical protein
MPPDLHSRRRFADRDALFLIFIRKKKTHMCDRENYDYTVEDYEDTIFIDTALHMERTSHCGSKRISFFLTNYTIMAGLLNIITCYTFL